MMRSYVFVMALGLAASGCHHHPKSAKSPSHPSSRSDRASGWTQQSAVQEDLVGPCTVPVVKDEYSGFEIGRPSGWTVEYGNGTIEVDKDPSETVGAIVYPARLKQGDLSADRLADMFANALGNSIRARGGSFALSDKQTDGRVAHAQAAATINGANLHGPLQVVSEKGFATVKLYWAPDDRFANEEPTLRQVVTCFKRHVIITKTQPAAPAGGRITRVSATGQASGGAKPATKTTALQPFQSKYFVGSMPAGWRIADETANGIDLVSGDQQLAVGFGWVLNGRAAPEATVRQTINQFHPGARIVSGGPVQTERPDQVSYAAEYDSPQAHGMSQSTRGPNAEVETSLAALPSRWESEKATLQAIAHSIQITPNAVSQVQANVRAQIASLPRATPSPTTTSSSSSSVMSSWADQERHDQAFSDALLGQDRATSPTTGQAYVVPWNAWNAAGPQGAGYYRATPGGGSELLDVQQ